MSIVKEGVSNLNLVGYMNWNLLWHSRLQDCVQRLLTEIGDCVTLTIVYSEMNHFLKTVMGRSKEKRNLQKAAGR